MRILALPCLLLLGAAPPAPEQRSFLITGFERLRVDGPFEVVVVDGNSPAARAEGSRAALDRVSIRTNGTTLAIGAGSLGWEARAGDGVALPRITIVAPGLRAVFVNGGGRVTVARLSGPRVEAALNGAGSLGVGAIDADSVSATLTGTGAMRFSGKAVQASFSSYGAGSIDASGLLANDLTVHGNTSGDGRYAARYTARVVAMGIGAVRVEGRPKCFVSGSAPISCGGNDNVERAN